MYNLINSFYLLLLLFRLLSIVIAAKPTSIDVNFITDLIFVDEDFIIDYANSVLHPNLKISGTVSAIFLNFKVFSQSSTKWMEKILGGSITH